MKTEELTLEQAALAWAQGKRVEAKPVKGGCWKPIDEIGECDAEKFSQSVFGFRDSFNFRLAHEPPAKKFRPYTRAELDGMRMLGEQVVHKDRKHTYLIIGMLEEAVHIGNSHYTFQNLFEEFTWSDGSPCGVEVSE